MLTVTPVSSLAFKGKKSVCFVGIIRRTDLLNLQTHKGMSEYYLISASVALSPFPLTRVKVQISYRYKTVSKITALNTSSLYFFMKDETENCFERDYNKCLNDIKIFRCLYILWRIFGPKRGKLIGG
jgi:hypothetical protein